MNKKQLLVNRELNDLDNWYAALHRLKDYKSVECADYYNTMSSAGDWEGFIVQRIGNKRYLILFFQENNYPRGRGFTAYTDEKPIACWKGKMEFEDVCEIIDEEVSGFWG